jgi:DNA-binding CsgD family transcriptional regulator
VGTRAGRSISVIAGDALQQSRPLNADELQVLRLVAAGQSRAQIADRLGWSPERVRDCLAGALAALGAASTLEAIIIAIRRGEL